MIDLQVKAFFEMTSLIKKMKRSMPDSLQRVGVIVRRDMRESLSPEGGRTRSPSAPGTPPHRQRGFLRNSILFSMDGDSSVIVGSMPRSYGWYGKIHEHGGKLRTKRQILRVYSAGDLGPLAFTRNPPRGELASQAQADRATKINRWMAKKAANARWHNSKWAEEKVSSPEAGFEPEYEAPQDAFLNFPARPFARPALIRNLDKIPPAFRAIL